MEAEFSFRLLKGFHERVFRFSFGRMESGRLCKKVVCSGFFGKIYGAGSNPFLFHSILFFRFLWTGRSWKGEVLSWTQVMVG